MLLLLVQQCLSGCRWREKKRAHHAHETSNSSENEAVAIHAPPVLDFNQYENHAGVFARSAVRMDPLTFSWPSSVHRFRVDSAHPWRPTSPGLKLDRMSLWYHQRLEWCSVWFTTFLYIYIPAPSNGWCLNPKGGCFMAPPTINLGSPFFMARLSSEAKGACGRWQLFRLSGGPWFGAAFPSDHHWC